MMEFCTCAIVSNGDQTGEYYHFGYTEGEVERARRTWEQKHIVVKGRIFRCRVCGQYWLESLNEYGWREYCRISGSQKNQMLCPSGIGSGRLGKTGE